MKYPRPTILPLESQKLLREIRSFEPQATPRLPVIRDYSQIVRRIRRRIWWETAERTAPFPYSKGGVNLRPNAPARCEDGQRVAEVRHESPNRAARRYDAALNRRRTA